MEHFVTDPTAVGSTTLVVLGILYPLIVVFQDVKGRPTSRVEYLSGIFASAGLVLASWAGAVVVTLFITPLELRGYSGSLGAPFSGLLVGTIGGAGIAYAVRKFVSVE